VSRGGSAVPSPRSLMRNPLIARGLGYLRFCHANIFWTVGNFDHEGGLKWGHVHKAPDTAEDFETCLTVLQCLLP
jgi:hypothetical protein